VLDQGAHYLSPFGTTGEALSLSPGERLKGWNGWSGQAYCRAG